ncbi:hypothetical protein HRbin36_00695 [bacterium HR36]|nr:hypothetical protein HRbin36_00695 [bacterium HR36]
MYRRGGCAWLIWLIGGMVSSLSGQVLDEAKFFSPDAALQADKQLRQLGQKHRLTLVLETFAQAPADIAALSKGSPQRAAAFHHWAEQRRAAHHAHLYILICRQPGRVEIAVHESLAPRFPTEKRDALRDTLLNHFGKKEYDAALRESLALLTQTLSGLSKSGQKSPAGPASSAHKPTGAEEGADPTTQKSSWSWVFWAILLGVGLLIVFALFRGLAHALSGPVTQQAPDVPPAGPGYGGGGRSFLGSFLAGMFGAAVGSWLYDRFFRGGTPAYGHDISPPRAGGEPFAGSSPLAADDPTARYAPEAGQVFTTGGDFDAPAQSGADFDDSVSEADSEGDDLVAGDSPDVDYDAGDIGGDPGGTDFGGGDFGGADFGGGDFGGDF